MLMDKLDDACCRRHRWHGTRTGIGFEQRIERRWWWRRRRRWRWLPGLSTLARFMARRTTTSTRSPPFPLRHITRQTDALPSTVRKNGSAQGVYLTIFIHKARLNQKTKPSIESSTCPLSSIVDDLTFASLDLERISVFSVYHREIHLIRAELDQDMCDDRAQSRATGVIPHRTLHRPGGVPIIGMMPYVAVV